MTWRFATSKLLRFVFSFAFSAALASSMSGQSTDGCLVQLNPSTTLRNTEIALTVTPAPTVTSGTILLSGPVNIRAAASLENNTVKYILPADLPLGRYTVTLLLDNRPFQAYQVLSVVPSLNSDLKLSPFTPAATYAHEFVWTPQSRDPRKGYRLETASLVLRGSGFLVDTPQDNQIFLNNDLQEITWSGCNNLPSPGKRESPVKNRIFGTVVSPERIELCRVPVPQGGVLRVAVRQGERSSEMQSFQVYHWSTLTVAAISVVVALLLGLAVLLLVHLLLSGNKKSGIVNRYNALKILFLDPETATYSLSKFQFYVWTAVALFAYCYLVISRIIIQDQPWPDIPEGLPAIIGIGAGTAVSAQFATNIRGPKGTGAQEPSFGDLVTSGGVAAPDRIQMFVWTLFGAAIYCLSVVKYAPGAVVTLDAVPSGILSMMGISSAGYLGGKIARKPGPIINEISITPSDTDDILAAQAAPPVSSAPPPNLAQPVAQAQALAQTFTNTPTGNGQRAVSALIDAITAASQVKSYADAQTAVNTVSDLRTKAEAAAASAAEEFAKPGAASDAGRAAEIAEQAAAGLQDLSSAVSSLLATAQAAPASAPLQQPSFTRVIELRGRNMSASDALFEIDDTGLPMRMLQEQDGRRLPQIVLHEPDNPTLARLLRLTIDPSQLGSSDYRQYKQWFGTKGGHFTLSIINPDGQKSQIAFSIPPSTAQSPGKTEQQQQQG